MTVSVSVVIPTFNRPALVQEAVESVLAQRGDAEFEIIVVDDGSTHDVKGALERRRDRIRYVRQQNAGLNAARNHALRLAAGEYIALLDDDDVWLPFKTSLQLAALAKFPQAGFVHSNFYIWKPAAGVRRADGVRSWFPRPFAWDEMYRDSTDVHVDQHTAEDLSCSSVKAYYGDSYYWALFAPMVLPSAAIIRRSALDELRFPEFDSTCGDWEFFARLSRRCGGVFISQETTLNRSHEDPWRLTRVESSIQLTRRIDFIRRLWRSDADFMRIHGREVDATEAQCLRKLAKRQLVRGEAGAARRTLAELRQLGFAASKASDYVLAGLAWAPFSASLAGALRGLKNVRRQVP